MQTLQKNTFSFELKDNCVGILTINCPDEKINKLSSPIFLELEEQLKEISKKSEVKALVIISSKKDCFIAGADIHELKDVDSAEVGTKMSEKAQDIFNRLSRIRMTTIAAIDGACMGGGLELALACDYRMVTDNPKTILSLPEVKLGLIPGAGGTQRLTRLVGLQEGIEMIVSGKNVRSAKAVKTGLADEIVPAELLSEISLERAKEFAQKGKRISGKHSSGMKDWLLEETKMGKNIIAKKAREKVIETTGGKYPAPAKALEVIIEGYSTEIEKGFKLESEAFGELCESTVSKNLIGIFEATNELKKTYKLDQDKKLSEIKKVGILGAGLMGTGIAKVSLDQDIVVRMRDVNFEAIGNGLKNIHDYFQKSVDKKIIRPYELQMKMDKVSGTTDYSGFKMADIVIEAVFEDLNLKNSMLKELEEIVSEDCILASNTSSIPISEIAKGLKHPERVIGMHFFSPVEKMPLLEIIVTPETADWVIAASVEFGKRIGKTVIIVNDRLGFYTTRVLVPYLNESLHMLMEGGNISQIDKVMTDFGFPVGPFKLLDEVGIDVGIKVLKLLQPEFTRIQLPNGFEELSKHSRLGKKNKKGFYNYSINPKEVDETIYTDLDIKEKRNFSDHEIKDRVVFSFLNEAVYCLEEKILRSPLDGDIGAIFGLGFPPFLGGPFRYMDSLGANNIVETLEDLRKKYGDRFKPSEMLIKSANDGKNFYS